MRKNLILLGVIFLFSACSLIKPTAKISDFESCAAAGNPVMESYPRQCRANGQTFVEVININVNDPNQRPCTMEAKLCPDGSAVGRSGPNCEFAPCPDNSAQPEPTAADCQKNSGTWLAQYRECEYISKDWCDRFGGMFNECESACRHNPQAEVCTLQCVPVCELK